MKAAGYTLLFSLMLSCHARAQTQASYAIGDSIPNCTFVYHGLDTVYLADLRGSLVFVDFWASWSPTSRKEHVNLQRIFMRYKDKKFRTARKFHIISVSIDTQHRQWEFALKRDALSWPFQVCDFSGWNSPYVNHFRVAYIPANFLLDEKGTVIGKDLYAEDLEDRLRALY